MALDFEKHFPALAKEFREAHQEEQARQEAEEDDWEPVRIPTAFDHLQRCDTPEDAVEVIEFFEQKGEIPPGKARELKEQLEEMGVDSFGYRDRGQYEKHGID